MVVLDADPIACAGWCSILEAQAWVDWCSGTTAVEECLVQTDRLKPHVVLIGLVLGNGCHGVEVCRQLTDEYPEVRVILVCDAESSPVSAVRAAGARGLLHRLWPVDAILSGIQRVAQGGVVLAGAPVRAAAKGRLSRREISVLQLMAKGASNAEIARALHLSQHTVKEYTQTVFRKLGVRNRVEAANTAARLGYDS